MRWRLSGTSPGSPTCKNEEYSLCTEIRTSFSLNGVLCSCVHRRAEALYKSGSRESRSGDQANPLTLKMPCGRQSSTPLRVVRRVDKCRRYQYSLGLKWNLLETWHYDCGDGRVDEEEVNQRRRDNPNWPTMRSGTVLETPENANSTQTN